MPITRSRGNRDTRRATSHITSSGFVTMTMIESRDFRTAREMHSATILALTSCRSSRLMPGLRARPAVMTMTSEPAVAS